MRRAWPLALALLVGCGGARAPLPPPAADRSWVPPLPTPSREALAERVPPALPPVVSFTLPSGLTVQIVEQRGVPVVYAALVGRGSHATRRAPAELDALLELALGDRVATETDPELADDDRPYAVHVNERGLTLTSRVVPSAVFAVLARYASVLYGAALTPDRIDAAQRALLDRVRFEQGQRARRRYASPMDDLFARLYGEDHVRVRRMHMRASRVERIDGARLREHLAELMNPAEAALVIVGDVDAASVEQEVRERFASLPPAPPSPPARRSAPAFPDAPTTRLRIHGTDTQPSAIVRLVEHGPAIEHEDHAAFRLFARLAGGMFSSALNLRLREARGDAYGVMTGVSDRFDHSVLEIGVVVPVGAAGAAASTIVEELARLSDAARIEPEELETARSVELAELAAELETSTGLGEALARAFLARQAPSAIVDRLARIAAVDAEAVAAAGRRWVRPERAPMVIVGNYRYLFEHPVHLVGGVGFMGD